MSDDALLLQVCVCGHAILKFSTVSSSRACSYLLCELSVCVFACVYLYLCVWYSEGVEGCVLRVTNQVTHIYCWKPANTSVFTFCRVGAGDLPVLMTHWLLSPDPPTPHTHPPEIDSVLQLETPWLREVVVMVVLFWQRRKMKEFHSLVTTCTHSCKVSAFLSRDEMSKVIKNALI